MERKSILLSLLVASACGIRCGAASLEPPRAMAQKAEVANRDKTGTSTVPRTTATPQSLIFPRSADGQRSEAEGMGLEPTTGCPAPEFQSGR